MSVFFGSLPTPEQLADYPRQSTEMECPNDSSKMDLFVGTSCLVCNVCGENRWLV